MAPNHNLFLRQTLLRQTLHHCTLFSHTTSSYSLKSRSFTTKRPIQPSLPATPAEDPTSKESCQRERQRRSLTPGTPAGGCGSTSLPATINDNTKETIDEDKIERSTADPDHDKSKEEDEMQVEIEANDVDADPPANAPTREKQPGDTMDGLAPQEGSDEWDSYARQHKARGFSAVAGSLAKANAGPAPARESVEFVVDNRQVKQEPVTEYEPSADRGATKSSSPSLTESLSSGGQIEPRAERKSTRRSSMQTGTKPSGSRSGIGKGAKDGKKEGKEKVDVGEDDDVERGDVTRCVCEKDGGYPCSLLHSCSTSCSPTLHSTNQRHRCDDDSVRHVQRLAAWRMRRCMG